MQDIEQTKRVVVGRIGHFIHSQAECLIFEHHLIKGKSEGMVRMLFHSLVDRSIGHVHVGGLEGNYHHWNSALQVEDILAGHWVEVNVELGSRSPVSLCDSPAHDDDLLYLLLDEGVGQEEDAQIGETASVDPDDWVGVSHDSLVAAQQSVLADRFGRRYLEVHISQSVLTVNVLCESHFSVDELVGAFVDLDIASADVVEDVQCISGGVFESAVAR